MQTLSQNDVRLILESLQALNTPCNLEEFPTHILTALTHLVSSEMLAYSSFSFQSSLGSRHYAIPNIELGFEIESRAAQHQNLLEHPLIHNFSRVLGQAHTISDFVSKQQFRRTNADYALFFRSHKMEDQMAIGFRSAAPQLNSQFHGERECILVSFARDHHGFTERDRLVVNLIRPHLLQAYQNVQVLTRLQQQHTHLHKSVSQIGMITLTADGQVQSMTQQAEILLSQYFQQFERKGTQSKTLKYLPDCLQQWINHQIQKWLYPNEIPAPLSPLQVERSRQRLTVRLINCFNASKILLLEESLPHTLSPKSLEALGLTHREAEVLFWIAKRKDTPEIAEMLHIEDRTVKKHLEHIYVKFTEQSSSCVNTRLAAVMYALEELGVLQ